MATSVDNTNLVERKFPATLRKDNWWTEPLVYFIVLNLFGIYSTFRALFGAEHLSAGPYLSPFFSPLFTFAGFPFSPAVLILPFPLLFRATCYYYRKAYYRSFFAQPYACGVGKPWSFYNGETKLLLIQNLHRFAMYIAVIFIFILSYDAIRGFVWPVGGDEALESYTINVWPNGELHGLNPHHASGGWEFGMGIGTLVLCINAFLLGCYTFGCHSLRHLVGGCVDCHSRATLGAVRFSLWKIVTKLNEKHALLAWCSLVWVGFTDFYIWAVSAGWISPELDRLF